MFAVVGSERDPVQVYDLYASKRADSLKTLDSPFCLAVNHTTKAINTKVNLGSSQLPWELKNSSHL